jgi:hypothetical protein
MGDGRRRGIRGSSVRDLRARQRRSEWISKAMVISARAKSARWRCEPILRGSIIDLEGDKLKSLTRMFNESDVGFIRDQGLEKRKQNALYQWLTAMADDFVE